MNPNEFKTRRQALLKRMAPGSLAIIPTSSQSTRSQDAHYSYLPDSDFYYLTGFAEPEAVAVLATGDKANYTLFCRERDATKEIWHGAITGPEGAVRDYGADVAFPLKELDERILKMLEQAPKLYYALGRNLDFDQRVIGWLNNIRSKIRTGVCGPSEMNILDYHLHELRLIKSTAELQAMRSAAAISAQAHVRVMRSCRPGMAEYALEAEFIHECTKQGARQQAYAPIIGGGSNGCVLHYGDNCAVLNDNELVLVDAGCEYDHYASDITRTFPINGRFSGPQQEIYELVLEAQAAAFKKLKPGNTWNDFHQAAVHTITKGLVELKILRGHPRSIPKLIREEQYKTFYMHRTGHWLGLDVHDVGVHKVNNEWRVFQPGMCLTVEPGIYIAPNSNQQVHKRWQGIGIRIEDDVTITTDGYEVLSAGIPKHIAEIEALVGTIN